MNFSSSSGQHALCYEQLALAAAETECSYLTMLTTLANATWHQTPQITTGQCLTAGHTHQRRPPLSETHSNSHDSRNTSGHESSLTHPSRSGSSMLGWRTHQNRVVRDLDQTYTFGQEQIFDTSSPSTLRLLRLARREFRACLLAAIYALHSQLAACRSVFALLRL